MGKKLISKCLKSSEAIYCDENSGPTFGYEDILIADNCNLNAESSAHIGYSYQNNLFSYHSEESKTFLTGSANFKVAEIEVFLKVYPTLIEVKTEF